MQKLIKCHSLRLCIRVFEQHLISVFTISPVFSGLSMEKKLTSLSFMNNLRFVLLIEMYPYYMNEIVNKNKLII